MKPLSDEAKAILEGAPRWQPIETAPKDGRKIVVTPDMDEPRLLGLAHWTGLYWLTEPLGRLAPMPDWVVLRWWLPLPASKKTGHD